MKGKVKKSTSALNAPAVESVRRGRACYWGGGEVQKNDSPPFCTSVSFLCDLGARYLASVGLRFSWNKDPVELKQSMHWVRRYIKLLGFECA